ncbi:MAG TPA: methyl-accepting chemotaxis protein [Chloroflexota bacterium]|nr:methyl-accepting chemotaxis protein [Chloroflexota bacterium]
MLSTPGSAAMMQSDGRLHRAGGWSRFADWPLRYKLLVPLLVVSLLPLLILLTLAVTYATGALQERMRADAASDTLKVRAALENATNKVAQDLLIVANASESAVYGAQPVTRNAFLGGLNSVWQYQEISAYDGSGIWIGGTNAQNTENVAGREWYQQALGLPAGTVVFSEPEIAADAQRAVFSVATPVFRADGRLLGVVRIVWDPSLLITQARAGYPTKQLDLYDRQGRLFATTRPNARLGAVAAERPPVQASRALAGTAVGTVVYNASGEDVIAGYSRLTPTRLLQGMDWSLVVEESVAQALAAVTDLRNMALLVLLIGVLLVTAVALVLSRVLARPAVELAEVAHRVQAGDLAARAPVTSRDELGRVAESLNAMLDEVTALVQTREERDALQRQITKLLDEVSTVAEGDLTVQAEVTPDVIGSVADAFNYMVAELRSIIENVNRTTTEVAQATAEILETSGELAQQSEQQARRIVEATVAVDQMAQVAQGVARNAATGSEIATVARRNADEGAEAVRQTIDGMARIRGQVQETAKKIKRLGESSQEIGQIVQLIQEIADQTNLLALNAAITAAMAGEHGRGFAVVADEVRRLAERASAATRQIAELVKSIQMDTAEAVVAMENGTREVVEGSRLAETAGQRLVAINEVVAQLAELIHAMAEAAEQQAQASVGVKDAMAEISQVTRLATATTRQAAESVDYLARLAEQLQASVAAFRLGPTEPPALEAAAARQPAA